MSVESVKKLIRATVSGFCRRSFANRVPKKSLTKKKKTYLINKSNKRGIEILRDPSLNKGTAFTILERQLLGIHGLLPPIVKTYEEQKERIIQNLNNKSSDLDRYKVLMDLKERNEKLFYRVVRENIESLMPIIYTPTVGLACQCFGLVFGRPQGIFISIKDKGHIYEVLTNWPFKRVRAIVVTDGERILGLGDLGAYGIGIPVGKLALYTALGGIHPRVCLPVYLDVGTNNLDLHDDPLYIGDASPRVCGPEYEQFLDEFMEAVLKRFGSTCLVQFEDFANEKAFASLNRYKDKYCMFNDDIQGTASVVLAGLLSSLKFNATSRLRDNKFLFLGAGEAGLGIANLLLHALMEEGATNEEATERIWMVDIEGLLTKNRERPIIGDGKIFAKDFKHMTNVEEIVAEVKPTHLIGASSAPGAFTQKAIQIMGSVNEKPVIFALSNPTSKAECTAHEAYANTQARCAFASGSPFPSYTVNGKTLHPGQANNAYIFPGVALAAITCGVHHIPDQVFLRAARTIASLVTEQHFAEGRLFPPLCMLLDVSEAIAVDLAEYFYAEGLASAYPEPPDKAAFIQTFLYDPEYENFVPPTWKF